MIYFTLRHLILYLFQLAVITSCDTGTGKNKPAPRDSTVTQANLNDTLPQTTGYVNDFEGIFTAGEKRTLDSLIGDFERKTTIQVAVITVDTNMTAGDQFDNY